MLNDSSVVITEVRSRKDLKKFIRFQNEIHASYSNYIPPLFLERLDFLNPKKNPFYHHAEVQLFLATRGQKVVGRISAQINSLYEKQYQEKIGHFGFFESIDDAQVAHALFEASKSFLKSKGCTQIQGPFHFSINQESGLLVEGFDQPMMVGMPFHPPYYARLIEGEKFQKEKDLYAWKYIVGEIPPMVSEITAELSKHPGLNVRSVNPQYLKRDLQIIIDIFNSAWSENWGFIPFTEAEIDKMAHDVKPFFEYEASLIVELDGKPIAMCVALPNFYEYIADLKGKLFPFGWLKLLRRMKRKQYQSARLLLLGVKKDFRKTSLGGLSFLLYSKIQEVALKHKIQWGELSWTLEDNKAVNMGIEFMGAKRYKTYRIYAMKL